MAGRVRVNRDLEGWGCVAGMVGQLGTGEPVRVGLCDSLFCRAGPLPDEPPASKPTASIHKPHRCPSPLASIISWVM